MKMCSSGKRNYKTEAIAVEALQEIYTMNSGGPINVYLCIDCGNYHFTSKGVMHPQLKNYLNDEKQLYRNIIAKKWADKLRQKY